MLQIVILQDLKGIDVCIIDTAIKGNHQCSMQHNGFGVVCSSEFVGCSPSLCGAIRVNPWSVISLADGMRQALVTSVEDQKWRHEKHWKYVSKNTVGFWAQSYVSELVRVTQDAASLTCYRMGLGLDTFKMVALDRNFRKLDTIALHAVYKR